MTNPVPFGSDPVLRTGEITAPSEPMQRLQQAALSRISVRLRAIKEIPNANRLNSKT